MIFDFCPLAATLNEPERSQCHLGRTLTFIGDVQQFFSISRRRTTLQSAIFLTTYNIGIGLSVSIIVGITMMINHVRSPISWPSHTICERDGGVATAVRHHGLPFPVFVTGTCSLDPNFEGVEATTKISELGLFFDGLGVGSVTLPLLTLQRRRRSSTLDG